MDDRNQDSPTAIAAEAVGQRDASETPDAATAEAKLRSVEAARSLATAAPSHANTADIAAEAVGERVGDAYPDVTTAEAREHSRNVVRHAATARFGEHPFLPVVVGLALGFVAGSLIQRRR
jgi:ElaB/YqjD/DUF883 family membrane-anchored ribosome-binding protein